MVSAAPVKETVAAAPDGRAEAVAPNAGARIEGMGLLGVNRVGPAARGAKVTINNIDAGHSLCATSLLSVST